jgi:tetratricopeptide (TPR) repeat protein
MFIRRKNRNTWRKIDWSAGMLTKGKSFASSFIVLLFFSNLASAQSAKQYLEKGNSYFEQQDFYAAAKVFGEAVEKFPDNIDFRYQEATALRLYNNYEDAATAYKNLLTDDTQKKYADAPFYYTLMLKQQGNYDLAIKQLERFKKGYKKKNIASTTIDQEIVSCKWALANSTPSSISIIHLSDSVNTPFSDFNPITTLDGGLLFTSLRPTSKSATNSKSKVYGIDSTAASLSKLLSKFENKHAANGHFNADFSLFYFNVCDVEAGKRCDIYVAKAENDSWSEAVEIKGVNHKNYTSTQPCIVLEDGQNYLYFSSDRVGTKGGMDIWKAKQTAFDRFEYPENVTTLNTEGNEYSVSFSADSMMLFLSSDGWNGYGGLDIFSYKLSTPDSLPKNLGLPINSPANDFGYHISADRTQAYFASNRKGALYIKSQTCCYDIWRYETGVIKSTFNRQE